MKARADLISRTSADIEYRVSLCEFFRRLNFQFAINRTHGKNRYKSRRVVMNRLVNTRILEKYATTSKRNDAADPSVQHAAGPRLLPRYARLSGRGRLRRR